MLGLLAIISKCAYNVFDSYFDMFGMQSYIPGKHKLFKLEALNKRPVFLRAY